MKSYKILEQAENLQVITDGRVSFQFPAPDNRFALEYAAWLAAGNVPIPPDPPTSNTENPTTEQRIEALELLVDFLLEEPTT